MILRCSGTRKNSDTFPLISEVWRLPFRVPKHTRHFSQPPFFVRRTPAGGQAFESPSSSGETSREVFAAAEAIIRRCRPSAKLIDVSGSMNESQKLPLLKSGLRMMVKNLSDRDRVAIVVYAGASGRVLPPTSCEDKGAVLAALERLTAGGSTNGGEGIDLAYRTVREFFDPHSINRVILCTDGDFNVGITDRRDLLEKIRKGAGQAVFLTALGFGRGISKTAPASNSPTTATVTTPISTVSMRPARYSSSRWAARWSPLPRT